MSAAIDRAETADVDRAPCGNCGITVNLHLDAPADCGDVRCIDCDPCLCDVEDPQDEKDQR